MKMSVELVHFALVQKLLHLEFMTWRPGCAPRSVNVGFLDKVALGRVFLRVLLHSHQYHFTMTPQTYII
jgi:hypothetical protein